MKSSIYISSEQIEVIGYSRIGRRVSIKTYVTRPLLEGTMINGKITDHAQLVECLTELRAERPKLFKNPTLTVDGNFILSKRITVPKLSKRQYRQLIRTEFADSAEEHEALICDYHLLGGSTAILAYASEKTQVESYISAFKTAGIKLKAIRIGMQAILNYISARPEFQKTTFVLNVIDGVTMLSMIFDSGVNVFISRTRLYGEERELLLQNILENLSGLIQFNKSENFNDIMYSYYLGLTDDDLRFMNTISPYPDIKLDTLEIFAGAGGAKKLSADAHFVYLNTLLGDDSIDFIRSYKMLAKLEKRQRRTRRPWIPALACVVALLAVPVAYLSVQISELDDSIRVLNDFMTSEDVAERSAELDRIIEETAYYADVANQLSSKEEAENSTASVSNRVLDLITQTSGDRVTVTQFDFNESTETMHVTGRSATETDSAAYVEALKKSKLIRDIYYTGYSYGGGQYDFSIDVVLAAREEIQ